MCVSGRHQRWLPLEELCGIEAAMRPAKSFTARVDELTDRNVELGMELEQWKSAASHAELLNRKLNPHTQTRILCNGKMSGSQKIKISYCPTKRDRRFQSS